jgi:hypothetical protein
MNGYYCDTIGDMISTPPASEFMSQKLVLITLHGIWKKMGQRRENELIDRGGKYGNPSGY